MTTYLRASVGQLVDRARTLATRNRRTLLGIAGAPGTGKSTLAAALVRELGDASLLVPMDGFHLSNEVLVSHGLRDRKGAPDTFDVGGYLALLKRLRDQSEDVVYAPDFRRDLEEPIAASIPVHHDTPLIITEGNYLLLDEGGWVDVRGLLDETWYLTLPHSVRETRLISRHVEFGKSPEAATDWVRRSDALNADAVEPTAQLADLVVELT